MDTQVVVDEFTDQLRVLARETGRDLGSGSARLNAYAGERIEHLSRIAGEPGFEEAVRAEAHNIMLEAGMLAVEAADRADERVRLAVQATVRFAARVIYAAAL